MTRLARYLDADDRQALALFGVRAGLVVVSVIGGAATLGAAWRVFCFVSGGC